MKGEQVTWLLRLQLLKWVEECSWWKVCYLLNSLHKPVQPFLFGDGDGGGDNDSWGWAGRTGWALSSVIHMHGFHFIFSRSRALVGKEQRYPAFEIAVLITVLIKVVQIGKFVSIRSVIGFNFRFRVWQKYRQWLILWRLHLHTCIYTEQF